MTNPPNDDRRWAARRKFWFPSGILIDRRSGSERRSGAERRGEGHEGAVASDRRTRPERRDQPDRRTTERRRSDRRAPPSAGGTGGADTTG
jgi:hypothetical protein